MTHRLSESIAREVRAEFARQRVTQRQAAEWLGISQSQIGLRLRNEIEFRLSELETLAEQLDVPVMQFMTQPEVAA